MTKKQRARIKMHARRVLNEAWGEAKYWSWKDETMREYLQWCLGLIKDLEACERRRKNG